MKPMPVEHQIRNTFLKLLKEDEHFHARAEPHPEGHSAVVHYDVPMDPDGFHHIVLAHAIDAIDTHIAPESHSGGSIVPYFGFKPHVNDEPVGKPDAPMKPWNVPRHFGEEDGEGGPLYGRYIVSFRQRPR